MKKLSKIIAIVIIFWVAGCSKKNDPTANLIDPTDANKLMEVIITPTGGQIKQGTPPVTSKTPGTLQLNIQPPPDKNTVQTSATTQTVNAYQNQTMGNYISYSCAGINGCKTSRDILIGRGQISNTPYCIFRIKGSDYYRVFVYTKTFGNSGSLSFPFSLPENIGNGQFETEFTIVDEYGLVSNYITTKVVVKRIDPKDNPALAFGCDFAKATSELLSYSNSFTANPTVQGCENVKFRYNELVTAMSNCKDITASSKAELAKANKDLQALDCSIYK